MLSVATDQNGAPQTKRQLRRQTKHDQIIVAARRLLLHQGYGTSSMDDIAQEAQVSKATLYSIFGNKADLFAAVIEREGVSHHGLILPDVLVASQFRTTLQEFSGHLLALLLSDGTISAYRSIATEASHSPQLGRVFYTSGPQVMFARLAAYLKLAMEKGLLRKASPRNAAVHFIGLIRGDLHTRALLGLREAITIDEQTEAVNAGIDAFMRAYQA